MLEIRINDACEGAGPRTQEARTTVSDRFGFVRA